MLRFVIASALVLATSGFAQARCDSYGNCYSSSGTDSLQGSSSSVYGSNSRTGSSWSSNYDSRGSSGIDSRGNSWSYDRGSGNYQNYGTGETGHRGRRY